MAKLLVIGDLHYDISDLVIAQLFNDYIADHLKEKRYDAAVLLGDVFDKFETVQTMTNVYVNNLIEIISSHCHLYILVGNHDFINARQFQTKNHSLIAYDGWKNVTVVDKAQKVKINKQNIILCPYVPTGRFLEALEAVPKWEYVKVIFAHQEFLGCQMGGRVSTLGDGWSEKFPMVVSGHCHDKHKVGNVFYVGTPYDTSFSSCDRYIGSVSISSEKIKLKHIQTTLPKKIGLAFTLEEAEEWEPQDNNVYRLKLKCSKKEYQCFCQSDHGKQLKKSGVKLLHISLDKEEVDKFLKMKKEAIGGCKTYSEIFQHSIEKEGLSVVAKKVLEN